MGGVIDGAIGGVMKASTAEPVRTMVLWFPDWPITALAGPGDAAALTTERTPGATPAKIAIVHANTVVACSAAARAEGVRRGQQRRDAQARCPALTIVPADPGREHRAFLPVLERIERLTPGVQVVRAGIVALRARGPSRYYGGEHAAAQTLIDDLTDLSDVRIGVADGLFTAERAARTTRTPGDVRIIPAHDAAQFLAPLSVATLDDDEIVGLLARLGVRTLGDFAALDVDKVRERFGERGVRLHFLAGGRDSRPVTPRTPPPDLARQIAFEPPLELADQVAFAVRQTCDDVTAALVQSSLVCTELRIELSDETGAISDRIWLHPTFFSAAEMVDRVRWQLESATGTTLTSAVANVRVIPEAVDAADHHAPGLFGQGPGARVHHALSRVQAMLGHRGVLTPAISGGRWLSERLVLVPWGDRLPDTTRDLRAQPWPGSLPHPLPATVFPDPLALEVTDASGAAVSVDSRGRLSAAPAVLAGPGIRLEVSAWAGPWTVREREWNAARRRHAHRFQLVDQTQTAWLVVLDGEGWWAEGKYD